jgi:translocation and assembly module TamB
MASDEPVTPSTPAAPAPRPRVPVHRHVLGTLLLLVALCALLIAGAYAFLSTQLGVDFAVDEIALRTDGRLKLEGATGSLLDSIHVQRIEWKGEEAAVTATDVTLRWTPIALLRRGVVVETLGAATIDIELKPSNTAAAPPTSLALPVEIAIERLAIATLNWHVGPRAGTIRGLGLGYVGGAKGHQFRDLTLAAEQGTLAGSASIGAAAPFPIDGRLTVNIDAGTRPADAALTLSGNLDELTVDGTGKAGDSRISGRVALAPLATVPLVRIAVDAGDLDLAAWDKSLPQTRLDVVVQAVPTAGGFSGQLEASNALVGPIDANRLPVRTLSARYAWTAEALQLDGLDARFDGGGQATGQARIPLIDMRSAGTWALAVSDIDLRRIYSALVATRLRGSVKAVLDAERQRVSGDIADRSIVGGVALAFNAVIAGRTIDIERFRATAGPGEVQGKGRISLAGERAFAIDATAAHVDPSRFGDFPAGDVSGSVTASGALSPSWRVTLDATVPAGSRYAGVPFSGAAKGTVTRTTLSDASVTLQVSTSKLTLAGSVGGPNDVVTASLDTPKLADIVPFLPAEVPRTLAGALHAKAQLRGTPTSGAIDLEANGTALKLSPTHTLGTATLRVALAAAAPGTVGTDPATRHVDASLEATNVVTPPGTFATARASVKGTLGEHAIAVAFTGNDIGGEASAHGALRPLRPNDPASGYAWSGTIDTLQGKGVLALRLTAPTTLTVASDRVVIGAARVNVADGSMQISDLSWISGRISSHGSFAAVPLGTAFRLAGLPLPFASTVTFGGDWALEASPRLNGSITVRRESGDLSVRRDAALDLPAVPMGITSAEVTARFADDSIAANAELRSTRAGSVSAKLTVGAIASAPLGKISPDAPLTLAINATLPTLQVLQPWIGTLAVVDGHATAELTARGTVAKSTLTGSVRADGLRFDAPQYGVHWTDGIFAARFADGKIIVDEMSLAAGTGKFTASGTVSSISVGDARADARLTWQADKFRALNRPDRHLVVDGNGTVAFENGKLALTGSLKAVEGRFVYVSDPSATLGDDVVVKGWPAPTPPLMRSSDLPLTLDLAVDLGERFSFSGEGLETGLQGTLRITNGPRGFVGKGTIRAVNGTYFAFGNRLTIDPGRLIFDGPLDNPGLDIVALRKNLAVEAGVTVSGTVRVPIIALTSNPPVPDGEKLSWLVLGHGLERTSGTDLAALQAASGVLLGRNTRSVTSQIAESVGLDDISIRGSSAASRGTARNPTAAEGQVLALSKRISDRLSLVYEQGLSVANNAIRIEYALTRSVSLQAEMGIVSGVGIRYNISFE